MNPAVVLESVPWKEIDKMVTFFVRDYGKIKGIASGGARSRKRFGGGLDPLTHVQLYFRFRENREFIRVEFCEEIETYSRIRSDLLRFGVGFYFSEITKSLFPEREANPEVFQLLVWGLRGLEKENDPLALCRKYEIRVISLAGYRPQVERCRICGKKAKGEDKFHFLAEAGEVVCSGCNGSGESRLIRGESLVVLDQIPRLGWESLNRLKLTPRIIGELDTVLCEYIHYRANREFRSREFIDSIRREDRYHA